MNSKKERNGCSREYLRLINFLLHQIKSPESHKRIFRFVQDEAMAEARGARRFTHGEEGAEAMADCGRVLRHETQERADGFENPLERSLQYRRMDEASAAISREREKSNLEARERDAQEERGL